MIAAQSGPRSSSLCLRTPCLVNWYGEEGCVVDRPEPQATPFSFTSTMAMLLGSPLS